MNKHLTSVETLVHDNDNNPHFVLLNMYAQEAAEIAFKSLDHVDGIKAVFYPCININGMYRRFVRTQSTDPDSNSNKWIADDEKLYALPAITNGNFEIPKFPQ